MKRVPELIEVWNGNYKELLPEELWDEYHDIYIRSILEIILYDIREKKFYTAQITYKEYADRLKSNFEKLIVDLSAMVENIKKEIL